MLGLTVTLQVSQDLSCDLEAPLTWKKCPPLNPSVWKSPSLEGLFAKQNLGMDLVLQTELGGRFSIPQIFIKCLL